MATSADVPAKFDVVINGQGYITVLDDQSGLYYRPRRSAFTRTPTFLERTNVSGDYGDDQQQFWLTFTQRDWSLGEQQRYFKSNDPDKARRYWAGSGVDVTTVPGQVALTESVSQVATTLSPLLIVQYGGGVAFATTTKVWTYAAGTLTDLGAHGLAGTPQAMATDGTNIYVTDTASIREWNGAAWSTFSAAGYDALAFLNNTLYGIDHTTGALTRFDTAGTATAVFTWKTADGSSQRPSTASIVPYGGKLLIYRGGVNARRPQLWLYDGTAPALVAELPANFVAPTTRNCALVVHNGIVYLPGMMIHSATRTRAIIMYWANGTLGVLWRSSTYSSNISDYPVAVGFEDKVVFYDPVSANFFAYDTVAGGVSTLGAPTDVPLSIAACAGFVATTGTNRLNIWPTSATFPTTGTIQTSLFDGESSLTKIFRGITVDFDAASDGNGGSVDIAYQVNSVDGAYTSLQTGATAGTEYTLSSVTGRSISVKVTLNKGTSTAGPVLKRIYVRAVPRLQQFRRAEYILDLSGAKGADMLTLRDGTTCTRDGATMAAEINTAVSSTSTISITDEFGTFTGIVEPDQSSLIKVKPGVYVAHIVAREV